MKHRLRHPIRSITEPFGKAGLTVAILALVLATTGAAFAASKLSGPEKKEVAKIAKKEARKYANSNPGAPGAPGKDGTNGTNGKDGTNGAPGADGESVEVNSYTGSECQGEGEEGVELTNGSGTAYACNGAHGTTGFTETLPAGKTLQGDWSLIARSSESNQMVATHISFGIPLAAPPAVHYIRPNGEEPFYNETPCSPTVTEHCEEVEERPQPAECPGNFEAPEAESGNLCVYATWENPEGARSSFGHNPLPKICPSGASGSPLSSPFACVSYSFQPAAADRFGFGLITLSAPKEEGGELKPTNVELDGTWAVTG